MEFIALLHHSAEIAHYFVTESIAPPHLITADNGVFFLLRRQLIASVFERQLKTGESFFLQ